MFEARQIRLLPVSSLPQLRSFLACKVDQKHQRTNPNAFSMDYSIVSHTRQSNTRWDKAD